MALTRAEVDAALQANYFRGEYWGIRFKNGDERF